MFLLTHYRPQFLVSGEVSLIHECIYVLVAYEHLRGLYAYKGLYFARTVILRLYICLQICVLSYLIGETLILNVNFSIQSGMCLFAFILAVLDPVLFMVCRIILVDISTCLLPHTYLDEKVLYSGIGDLMITINQSDTS